MLQPGDRVPHFDIRELDGSQVDYSKDIWQRKNLLFVSLPAVDSSAWAGYVARLGEELTDSMTEIQVVVTSDTVSGLPQPGVLIADRWGEIFFVASPTSVADLPSPRDLVDWLDYIRNQCPECEGEAR